MSKVIVVDTSVLLNILDVPGRNQNRQAVLDEFLLEGDVDSQFLVPYGAILETGNHIAHLSDSGSRKKYSTNFSAFVNKAIIGELPLKSINFPGKELLEKALADFSSKAEQGIGLVDTTIIQEYNECVLKFPGWVVKIWALDGHLVGYEHYPSFR